MGPVPLLLTAVALSLCLAAGATLAQPLGNPALAGDRSEQPPAAQRRLPIGGSELDLTALQQAIRRGTAFLLTTQAAEGSWGHHRNAFIWEAWPAIEAAEAHQSWKVATTGLCCMALLQAQPSHAAPAQVDQALRRAAAFLADHAVVKRCSSWDTDNVWGYVYGFYGIVRLRADPRFADPAWQLRLGKTADALLQKLWLYQSPLGGWAYYDMDGVPTRTPNWATSFTTAVVVLALEEARDQGLSIDPARLAKAARCVARCRLANGAFSYSVTAIPDPRGLTGIDQVQGSLGRIQVCNLALRKAGHSVTEDQLAWGLEQFQRHHRFLAIARKKPIPHEAYHANSGYFYCFAHHYAAEVVAELPPDRQRALWPAVVNPLLAAQERDGSVWDYAMSDHTKPYGTAYSLMAWQRAAQAKSAAP